MGKGFICVKCGENCPHPRITPKRVWFWSTVVAAVLIATGLVLHFVFGVKPCPSANLSFFERITTILLKVVVCVERVRWLDSSRPKSETARPRRKEFG